MRRRATFRTWFGVAAWLLLLQPWIQGQELGRTTTGPASKPARTTENGTPASRAATDLERALADLRKAQTIAAAALTARTAYALGDEGRRALLDICREKTLAQATFEGVVGQFEFERDPVVLPVLFEVFGTGDAARDRYIADRLRAFDSQRSMLDDIFSRIDKADSDARRRTLLRVLAEIVDSPAERMQAARFLILAFQRSEFRDYTADLKTTLQKITFHDYPLPALWQKWLETFSAAHPEGFTEGDLYASALKDRDQRFLAEVKRSISVAITNKQIPSDYLDPVRYPEPAIRAHAAQELAGLKEAEPEVVKQAAKTLLEAVPLEKDEDVIGAMLRSIGALAENREEIKQDAAPALLPYLKDERDPVVVAALKAIAQTGTGSDCHVIEDLYSGAAMSKRDRASVRAQVVTTLYSLDCGSPAIVTALEDVSADVRASAARGLGYGKRVDAAPRIARALRAEKNDEAQRVMTRALVALQTYPPEVVDTLLELAGKPGVARDAAVRGLIQAASTAKIDGERAERLVTLLCEALPVLVATPEKRKAVLDDLQGAKGPLAARVLLKWIEVEPQADTAKELALILARVGPLDPEALRVCARGLIATGHPAAAVVLLRSAIESSGTAGTTTQSTRYADLRVALARALLIEKSSDGLSEAETIASQELRGKPDDGQLLLLRGAIREALGRRFEAAEDLRRALKTEGMVMADPQRQDAERKTALLLLSEDPKKAKEFLDALPPLPRDSDFLVVLGRVDLALDDPKQAVAHLRAALRASGKDDASAARYYLAKALLKSSRADDLLEAKGLFDVLDVEPNLPEGLALQILREEVRINAAARNAVRELDEVSQEGVSCLTNVLAIGDRALPWLIYNFADLARTAPLPALERRITAVQGIIVSDAASSRAFAALGPPTPGSARETWLDFVPRLSEWWDKHR